MVSLMSRLVSTSLSRAQCRYTPARLARWKYSDAMTDSAMRAPGSSRYNCGADHDNTKVRRAIGTGLGALTLVLLILLRHQSQIISHFSAQHVLLIDSDLDVLGRGRGHRLVPQPNGAELWALACKGSLEMSLQM